MSFRLITQILCVFKQINQLFQTIRIGNSNKPTTLKFENGIVGIVGKILNKDGKYKMKDAEIEAEKQGIAPETLRGYFKQMGIKQEEADETAVVTPRASAIRINRFA